GHVPELVRACPRRWPRTERDVVAVQAKVLVDRGSELDEGRHLLLDLVLAAENVRIVLRERAHAHQPVQRARWLVAMARPELRHAQRQVAIALLPELEDLHVALTV